MKRFINKIAIIFIFLVGKFTIDCTLLLAAPENNLPVLNFIKPSGTPAETATTLQILIALTVLSLAPSILIMMTSFIRIIIVLSFVRNGMGMQQVPPNQVLIGLALFITFFIMAPVFSDINKNAVMPYLNQQISTEEAFKRAEKPLRDFMFKQTREKDLALFLHYAKLQKPVNSLDDVPTYVLIPSFIISELKTAFQMGFIIFLPFLVIDMIVASTLMSMGMLMLPPIMISLPFKILLFVMVDGWDLVIKSLIAGFH
ncbi:flagellar type III secretion system pore protein FliP [Thermovenabulum gondwanense]|uniref:Flagellar biosynthetic protein FliP n=1 Tax=Thermovenabulum gondwanense TaxID=520767 RepID=A0A162M967_9FIRM|nr:flagellar type III secretion system pore protein FliP [Thermovenabulum gondwanense]KYO64573.1 Flagellar biosynthetic protein FliP [Thermovenabulum gondwanense]